MKFFCNNCQIRVDATPQVVAIRRRAGLFPMCGACGEQTVCVYPKSGRTDSQRRSKLQEKRAAKRVGGRVQPASGAGRAKGDVRVPGELRMECKLTRASSYSLRLDLLQKIERECTTGEKPIFEIEFQGVFPTKRYVVLPGWLYDHYANLEEVPKSL